MNGIRKQGMVVAAVIVGLAIVVSQGSPSATAAGGVCGEDGSRAGFGRGQRAEARGPELPSFGELAAVLRLTDDQRVLVEPAVEELQDDMDQFRGRGRGQRGPEQGAWAGSGGLERPMHDFLGAVVPALDVEQVEAFSDYLVARRDARRDTNREGRSGGKSRGGRGRHGMSAGSGPGAGAWLGGELRRLGPELDLDDDQRDAIHALMEERRGEFRAVHEGLESGDLSAEQVRDQAKALRRSVEEELGQILSEEQSSRLAELRNERRTEMADRREKRADERVERRADLLTTALELDDATAAKVRDALESSEAEQRAVRVQLQNGEIEIEDALYQGHVITQETSAGIAAALDGDQARKFEALHRLLPGGGRHGR